MASYRRLVPPRTRHTPQVDSQPFSQDPLLEATRLHGFNALGDMLGEFFLTLLARNDDGFGRQPMRQRIQR